MVCIFPHRNLFTHPATEMREFMLGIQYNPWKPISTWSNEAIHYLKPEGKYTTKDTDGIKEPCT